MEENFKKICNIKEIKIVEFTERDSNGEVLDIRENQTYRNSSLYVDKDSSSAYIIDHKTNGDNKNFLKDEISSKVYSWPNYGILEYIKENANDLKSEPFTQKGNYFPPTDGTDKNVINDKPKDLPMEESKFGQTKEVNLFSNDVFIKNILDSGKIDQLHFLHEQINKIAGGSKYNTTIHNSNFHYDSKSISEKQEQEILSAEFKNQNEAQLTGRSLKAFGSMTEIYIVKNNAEKDEYAFIIEVDQKLETISIKEKSNKGPKEIQIDLKDKEKIVKTLDDLNKKYNNKYYKNVKDFPETPNSLPQIFPMNEARFYSHPEISHITKITGTYNTIENHLVDRPLELDGYVDFSQHKFIKASISVPEKDLHLLPKEYLRKIDTIVVDQTKERLPENQAAFSYKTLQQIGINLVLVNKDSIKVMPKPELDKHYFDIKKPDNLDVNSFFEKIINRPTMKFSNLVQNTQDFVQNLYRRNLENRRGIEAV